MSQQHAAQKPITETAELECVAQWSVAARHGSGGIRGLDAVMDTGNITKQIVSGPVIAVDGGAGTAAVLDE